MNDLANAIYRIASLPSAPTHDWPTQAANALAHLAPSAAFAVVIANIDPVHHKVRTDASGVSSNTNHPATHNPFESRATLERLGAIGPKHTQRIHPPPHQTTDLAPYLAPLVTTASSLLPQWYASQECSATWRSTLPQQTLAGYASLERIPESMHPRSPQRIALICIATPSPATADLIDHDMFASAISTLAHKASTINNAQPNGTIQWLTQREQAILDQLILGSSIREIAESIDRSPHTVHDHVKNLHKKLNASSRGQLIAKALGHQEQPANQSKVYTHIDHELGPGAPATMETKQFNHHQQVDRVIAQPLSHS